MKMNWRWVVAGNIKKTRIDENGILRYGTAAFKGNAKVYLSGHAWDERFPSGNKTDIAVLGLGRNGRYQFENVPIELIENVRLTKVYTPTIVKMMSNFEYCECWWGNTQEDRDDASAFLKRWYDTYKTD